jgi:hypothetical protein
VAIAGGWSLIGWVISGTNPTGGIYFWAFLPTIPIMAVVAYRLAPRTVTAQSPVCPALLAGLVTVMANAYVLGCVMAVPMFGPHPAVLVQGFGLAVIGLMFFGLPGLAISVPSAFLWAVLTREVFSRRRPQRSSGLPTAAGHALHADPSATR